VRGHGSDQLELHQLSVLFRQAVGRGVELFENIARHQKRRVQNHGRLLQRADLDRDRKRLELRSKTVAVGLATGSDRRRDALAEIDALEMRSLRGQTTDRLRGSLDFRVLAYDGPQQWFFSVGNLQLIFALAGERLQSSRPLGSAGGDQVSLERVSVMHDGAIAQW
jgi:hypothetical protein